MYEQIYNLTGMFFKCLKGNLMYEFLISKFNGKRGPNINRLMSRFECYHIKHRSIIESDCGTLKNNFQLEYHKARSIVGMFRTYLIFPLFPAPFPAFYSYPSI